MVTVEVPADGPFRLGSVQLSVGRRLSGWYDDAPLLWATSEPVPDAGRMWQVLADRHPDTGLVPILLRFIVGDEGRPWDEGELNDRCDLATVDRLDPAEVLAQSWAGSVPSWPELEREPDLAEIFEPHGLQFPGLAPGQDQALTEAELARALDWFGAARIGLVPAARPADVLAVVGYNGTVNRYGTPEMLSAALRSWEDRFGAVLVEVGFDHIRMLVRRPPRTLPDAQAVAAELWAMCDEFWPIDQPGTAVRALEDIAELIVGSPVWSMWLD